MNKILQVTFDIRDPQQIDGADYIGINTYHLRIPEHMKINSWLQMHKEDDLPKEGLAHLEWLARIHPFSIYMVKHFEEFPSSIPYPLADARNLWAYDWPVSFASSFDYAVALGILRGYKVIHLEHCYLVTPREAYIEAPNLMLWVGIAKMNNVEVVLSPRFTEQILYGYESRGIPGWAPDDLIKDVIVDYLADARLWYKYMLATGRTEPFHMISKEEAYRYFGGSYGEK